MHKHEVPIDVGVVRALIASQFPSLGDAALTLVEPWGTDNAIWRVGDDHVVRLPRIKGAVAQIGWEAEWMPLLAPHLTVALPTPVFVGEPAHDYPFPWALHRWMPGVGAGPETIADPVAFATDLAAAVQQLQEIDTAGGRPALNRAQPIQALDGDTRQAIADASHLIDAEAATAIWNDALAATPHGEPSLWVHGDLEGNCITVDGQLHGLIDWGLGCVGDPAVDVQVVWSNLFTPQSRAVFLDLLAVDDATIARSRGAALNQACGALPYYLDTYPLIVERSWHKLEALGVNRHVRPYDGGNGARRG